MKRYVLQILIISMMSWSVFGATLLSINHSNTATILTWGTVPGTQHGVEASSAIAGTNSAWHEITNLVATSSTATAIVQNVAGQQYFRVWSILPPLTARILTTPDVQLSGVVTIPIETVSQDSTVAYVALRVWQEGSLMTNLPIRIDMLRNPTNAVVVDTRLLHSRLPHYMQLEVCDIYGNPLTGDQVRWVESLPVRFIPSNALSLLVLPQVGWKFVADIVPSVTNGTWKCVVSNSAFSKTWTGTIVGNGKIRVSDNITDFNHAYPGNSFRVHVTVTSAGGNSSLVKDLDIDRRPVSSEGLIMEDNSLLNVPANDVHAELNDVMRRFQVEFFELGGTDFSLSTLTHNDLPQNWNVMNETLWNNLRAYLHSDYARASTHLYAWVPGIGPTLGGDFGNLTVSYLQSLAVSNRQTLTIVDGHNGLATLRELGYPTEVSREYLFEWGQYPRFGFTWKGNPYLLFNPQDISDWHAQFMRRFREKAFEKQFELGVRYFSEALEYACILDNGQRNPLADYLVVMGCGKIYCDEIRGLTDYPEFTEAQLAQSSAGAGGPSPARVRIVRPLH